MPKFFVNPEDIKEDNVFMYEENVKHIIKVLRLEVNDEIIVCDGNCNDYKVSIKNIDKTNNIVKAKILSKEVSHTEPHAKVTLYQGIPKLDKMEFIIQKAVEVGIDKIVPVITTRTVVKIKNDKSKNNKLQRWRKIAHSAAKQSGRGKIPQVYEPISFDKAVDEMKKLDLAILPYENEKNNSLKDLLKKHNNSLNIGIFIGPEGGFDDEEIEKAQQSGLNIVTLGPRILRTETAGVVVLSVVMYETGGI